MTLFKNIKMYNISLPKELGPGQYETLAGTTADGRYYVSRFVNSACRKIGRSKRQELAKRSETPGPGQCTLLKNDR